MKQKILKRYIIESREEREIEWDVWETCDTRQEARKIKKRLQAYYKLYRIFSTVKFRIVQETWNMSEKKVIN